MWGVTLQEVAGFTRATTTFDFAGIRPYCNWCPLFHGSFYYISMEAATHHSRIKKELPKAMLDFFAHNNTLIAKNTLAHLFKAWACQPEEKKQLTNEEIAVFLDQLIDLVAAAQTLHEVNTVLNQNEPVTDRGGHHS